MFNIEKVSQNIAVGVSRELKLDQDNKEIIAYGTFAIVQIFLSTLLILIFGVLFEVTLEALVICIAGSVLRKYSGGAHSSSSNICIGITTIICIGQAILISALIIPINSPMILMIICTILFVWSYFTVFKLAPVDSPSKPIKTLKKKTKMKKGSIIVLSIYVIIVIANMALYIHFMKEIFMLYALCVCGGVAWQTFTLTRLGHFLIDRIDIFFHRIFKINGRRN